MNDKLSKDLQNKFPTGSVFKFHKILGGGYAIVVDHVQSDGHYYCNWISLTSTRTRGGLRHISYDELCPCSDCNNYLPDDDCETCKGSGRVSNRRGGLDVCHFVARNVKEWITKELLKGFDF